MKKDRWVEESIQLINQHLQLEEGELSIVHHEDVDTELFRQLLPLVQRLLDQDMSRLLNALYRIDVAESKVNAILHLADPDKIAPMLARLIMDREYQKVETRKKYS